VGGGAGGREPSPPLGLARPLLDPRHLPYRGTSRIRNRGTSRIRKLRVSGFVSRVTSSSSRVRSAAPDSTCSGFQSLLGFRGLRVLGFRDLLGFKGCGRPLEPLTPSPFRGVDREFFIDNLLVRIDFITVLIRWTGLAPWEFESPIPGSLASTFLGVWTWRLQVSSSASRRSSLLLNCRFSSVTCECTFSI